MVWVPQSVVGFWSSIFAMIEYTFTCEKANFTPWPKSACTVIVAFEQGRSAQTKWNSSDPPEQNHWSVEKNEMGDLWVNDYRGLFGIIILQGSEEPNDSEHALEFCSEQCHPSDCESSRDQCWSEDTMLVPSCLAPN